MRLYYSIFQSPQQVILTKRGVQKITVILAPSIIITRGVLFEIVRLYQNQFLLIPVEFTPGPSAIVLPQFNVPSKILVYIRLTIEDLLKISKRYSEGIPKIRFIYVPNATNQGMAFMMTTLIIARHRHNSRLYSNQNILVSVEFTPEPSTTIITTVVKRHLRSYHFNDEAKDIRSIFCMYGM